MTVEEGKRRAQVDHILGIKYCYFALHRKFHHKANPNCSQELKGIPLCCLDCKKENCFCRCKDFPSCQYRCLPGDNYLASKTLSEFNRWVGEKNESKRYPYEKKTS